MPRERIWKIFLLLIILTGILLRVTDLNRKAYFEVFTALRISGYDEHDQANPALYTGQPISVAEIQKFQTFNDENDLRDTVRGLINKEPQVAPLYFVVAALVSRAVNNTPFGTRLTSALAGVVALAALFWLCVELFRGTHAAWWATALAAASPLWLRYAQEARMYILWLALLLLACALCVRATRTDKPMWWVLYTFAFMLSLYTHMLGVLVLGALGLYVLATTHWRLTRHVWWFALATAVALILFLPWVRYVVGNFGMARATMGYLNNPLPLDFYLSSVGFNLTRTFFGLYAEQTSWLPFVALPLAALALYAMYFLVRRAPAAPALFVLALIGFGMLPFLLMDLLLGGNRMGLANYLLPALVGVEICVGYLFAEMVTTASGRGRVWQVGAVVLLLGSLVSTFLTWRSPAWWDLLESDVLVASLVSEDSNRIVVGDFVFGDLARLSSGLPPDTRFIVTKTPDTFTLPATDAAVFVYNPSPALKARLEQSGVALQLILETTEPNTAATTLYRRVPQ